MALTGGGAGRRARRRASHPFSQRNAPVVVKAATKIAASAVRALQKICEYPTEENQSQSTRTSPATLSISQQITATMAAMIHHARTLRPGTFDAGPVIPMVMSSF